jgi:ABC-type transport system substrate-binding protein
MRSWLPSPGPNQYLNAAKNLSMGSDKPPFADARVRKALSLRVDRDEFLKVFSGGNGQWALAGSMPGIFSERETKQILSYDPEQAKQLLTEAGYQNGIDAERRELLRAAVRYINETPWSIGLYHGTAAEFLTPSLKNYGANFSRPGMHLTESWLAR